jgi:hypothetical protein
LWLCEILTWTMIAGQRAKIAETKRVAF